MGASLFQKLIDMVSIKYQSLSKHPDKPIVVPISNNSEKRKAVKIQYQSTSTFKKNNNTNILLMPLKAMIAKTKISKSYRKQQQTNPITICPGCLACKT